MNPKQFTPDIILSPVTQHVIQDEKLGGTTHRWFSWIDDEYTVHTGCMPLLLWEALPDV